MNLPNKLTLFRVILIPFFVFFLLAPYFEGYGNYIAVAIFIIASITDFLDGKIARKYGVTIGEIIKLNNKYGKLEEGDYIKITIEYDGEATEEALQEAMSLTED